MTPTSNFNTSIAQTAVIYCRFSSHSQRDVSIEQQVRHCKQFADRQGIDIVNVYEDRALTGTNDNRPGFQKMIRDAEKAGWNYVIVYTLDRFARNRYDSADYKRQLKKYGTKVISAMENISDDPTGILMESLLEGLAEYYSAELSQKIKRGNYDNARKCKVNGSLPLGYVRGEDGCYAIDEAEAAIVKEVYRRVSEGQNLTDIIIDLNRRGIRTKRGYVWSRASFNKLLSNERYTGVYIYGDVRVPGGVPEIIPKKLFDEVQTYMRTKKNPREAGIPQRRRRENSVYLLTGKLFCGHCKSPMIGISGSSKQTCLHYYYTCRKKRIEHACDKQNIRREYIETIIATALKDTMLTDQAIRALARAAIEYQNKQNQNSELEGLRAQLAANKKATNNVLSAIEAGIFTASTKDRLTELEAEQRHLTALVALAEQDAEAVMTEEEIVTVLELFQEGDINDKDYQEALIDTFLVAAYLYDDEIKIVFNLGGKKKTKKLPFNIEDVSLDESNSCLNNSQLHQYKGRLRAAFFIGGVKKWNRKGGTSGRFH